MRISDWSSDVCSSDLRTEQFGRHVGEVDRLTVDAGREGITAVEFGADEAQPADDDAGALNREVIGIVAAREAIDRDAGDALQRFGDRAIGQGADKIGRASCRERVWQYV